MTSAPPSHRDPHDLDRFVLAQESVFDRALTELRAGHKETHWMWFIFPQCAGLGFTPMNVRFSIKSRAEAAAYLAHPTLGRRLREAATASMSVASHSAHDIFADDARKLHSSATLFDAIEPASVFDRLLAHFFDGVRDAATVKWLAASTDEKSNGRS
ncbi:MAG: DUF1810 domain-containing protein [Gemmatimonadaceae bacterium]|nr:DUF1810 domain-containing protein [Gemmatimonadaceae bacterium]